MNHDVESKGQVEEFPPISFELDHEDILVKMMIYTCSCLLIE